jgi:hypothetical protein
VRTSSPARTFSMGSGCGADGGDGRASSYGRPTRCSIHGDGRLRGSGRRSCWPPANRPPARVGAERHRTDRPGDADRAAGA